MNFKYAYIEMGMLRVYVFILPYMRTNCIQMHVTYTVLLLPARIHIRMYSTVQYLYLIPIPVYVYIIYSIYVCVYTLCARC